MRTLVTVVCVIACILATAVSSHGQEAKASLVLSFATADSVKQVTATVTKTNEAGEQVPVKDVEIIISAKKSFGLLPLGDAVTTDESGKATVDFPADLPGDAQGNVTVVAKVDDNAEVGSLEASQSIQWGRPVIETTEINKRALWASGSNAPLPLVITVTAMVAGVWGVILYIIYLLIKIKKTGTYET